MGWKYVMFENTMGAGTKFLIPVIFPDKLAHVDVAAALRHCQPGWERGGVIPVSAGMIESISVNGLHGSSESLNLNSKEIDVDIIELYEYNHGIIE